MTNKPSRWLVSSNLFGSGIVELWFNSVVYSSIAAAFAVLADQKVPQAWPLAAISYILCMIYVVFKSRLVYEHLSVIYVYSQSSGAMSWFASCVLSLVRFTLLVIPVALFFLFRSLGEIPV